MEPENQKASRLSCRGVALARPRPPGRILPLNLIHVAAPDLRGRRFTKPVIPNPLARFCERCEGSAFRLLRSDEFISFTLLVLFTPSSEGSLDSRFRFLSERTPT
jgi:hypothetical protein